MASSLVREIVGHNNMVSLSANGLSGPPLFLKVKATVYSKFFFQSGLTVRITFILTITLS